MPAADTLPPWEVQAHFAAQHKSQPLVDGHPHLGRVEYEARVVMTLRPLDALLDNGGGDPLPSRPALGVHGKDVRKLAREALYPGVRGEEPNRPTPQGHTLSIDREVGEKLSPAPFRADPPSIRREALA